MTGCVQTIEPLPPPSTWEGEKCGMSANWVGGGHVEVEGSTMRSALADRGCWQEPPSHSPSSVAY